MSSEQAVAIRVAAPAKVNLYLHVVGRRADGLHELDSLVAFADIGDVVTASPAADLSFAIDGPFAGSLAGEADNLVLRAATSLAAHLGIVPAAALRLTKNLPVASGIGGGSSDAAATLVALSRLWRGDLAPAAMDDLAVALGADVPVCLFARPAWLGGIGEAIAPAPALPETGIVLVNPGIALPTPAVFKARRGAFSAPARFAEAPRDAAALAALLRSRGNDLAPPAIAIVPEIATVLDALEGCDGALLARMSGSGATCFALFATREAAVIAAGSLAAERLGWWVAGGRLLTDRPA
ncbi:MAG: 4-(cytidine 5-diphospho)-2-C-methyl-D-erythritol kinase [Rhodospirillales bacterium]|nr:4-(cytidine 5-diphospho)-2-C-methyl-D-erythritol kinase [Rhodospirillales bacterium]